MFARFLVAFSILPFAWAFSDSTPLVAWTTHKSALVNAFLELQQPQVDALLSGKELCKFDAVIIVDQPGLHAQDLKKLPSSATVPSRMKAAQKSMQLPYTRRFTADVLVNATEALAHRCGSRIQWGSTTSSFEFDTSSKHVLHMALSSISGEAVWRKRIMSELESSLARAIREIESAFPNHFFLYTGSDMFDKRQFTGDSIDLPFSFTAANSTGGILQNYQLLTPGLIVSLLVSFFLLVPIIIFSVQALASIQSSVRLDAPRGLSQDKKKPIIVVESQNTII
ncbi:hypothetical protein EW145_g2985 [Phellinidium pouzarii]|uniref:Protein BIG1 n=1 Tax=Phellinidium pouzarii TaxID=167371 RepID=A0A4S4L917_9AGAM|nr:hypothetical protein EW145_g2985 [Phellinidium pouzarii]